MRYGRLLDDYSLNRFKSSVYITSDHRLLSCACVEDRVLCCITPNNAVPEVITFYPFQQHVP